MAKILIVDDDVITRDILEKILSDEGHIVIKAESGVKVPDILKTEIPDMMICDMVMPDRDGIETIKDARKKYPELPIISMSGMDSGGKNFLDYLDYSYKLGANNIILKPLNKIKILDMINKYLE